MMSVKLEKDVASVVNSKKEVNKIVSIKERRNALRKVKGISNWMGLSKAIHVANYENRRAKMVFPDH